MDEKGKFCSWIIYKFVIDGRYRPIIQCNQRGGDMHE